MDVSGKTAIVTGGGRGLGRGIAIVLATNGADVVAADINLGDAQSVADEVVDMGRRSVASHVDVTEQESVERMAEQAVERFGRIDILVNNAGTIGAPGWEERERPDENDWDLIYAVNVKGMARVTDVVAGYMKERRYGKIVNIASGTFFKGTPFISNYVASKGGVVGITRSLAREGGDFGITVNCIAPGLTNSDEAMPDAHWEVRVPERAIKRVEVPEDLVGAAIFFMSADSDFMTGQTIIIDGGIAIN